MSEARPYPITEAVVRQRTEAATRHGAKSEVQIRAVARSHKRRLMRQMNLRIGDLDGIAAGYLDGWARAWAKVTLLDEHFAQNGLIAPGGTDATLRVYFTAVNTSRLQLQRLSEHLARYATSGEDLDGLHHRAVRQWRR